ncbi:hypothetical protein DUNSADRAFT_3611 [Dunaliella salina]|uniref:Encoded protein n=1 Tax=Dunaliella salina TaxID=3046 RepID=A0ABQ7FVB0_DUNSA|nr:hypothetical protein DUNSADRAFT_3611 [Dunaliella salina]|eukprot:KAF5826318.1 hypothetical protein DUNSADRAFT_3611 [Dunaliella salina]
MSPKFKQGTQPWHAAREAACTASHIATLLGLVSYPCPPTQASQLAMSWGSRHEANGLAAVMNSINDISDFMLRECSLRMPCDLAVHEQGLFFLPYSHPILDAQCFPVLIPLSPLQHRQMQGWLAHQECTCYWRSSVHFHLLREMTALGCGAAKRVLFQLMGLV